MGPHGRHWNEEGAEAHGPRFGGFGAGMGGGFRGRGIKYWALYLLREKPMTGAEIMESMESQSMGWWRPSPGSIYPMLNGLVEDGVLSRDDDGRYSLTDKGYEYMGISRDRSAPIERALSEMEGMVEYLHDNRELLKKYSDRLKKIKEGVDRL